MRLRYISFVKRLPVLAHMRQLPDFIIIGAQRCGTTSLYRYLSEHPCVVPASRKEVHYFDLNYDKGDLWYRAHFPLRFGRLPSRVCRERHLTGEASPYYIFHPLVPSRMAKLLPHVKLIALLRNPVDRAYSQYHHELKAGIEHLSFEEAIACEQERLREDRPETSEQGSWVSYNHQHFSYLSRGIYLAQLENWMSLFAPESVLVLKSEEFYEHPESQLSEVLGFLGLPDWHVEAFVRYNRLQYPEMSLVTRQSLVEFFRPHNERLYEFLGIDFGWQCDVVITLCTTGMRRSETCPTAFWRQLCGREIEDRALYGPGLDNPKGHFQDEDFVKPHTCDAPSQDRTSDGWRTLVSDLPELASAETERLLRTQSDCTSRGP